MNACLRGVVPSLVLAMALLSTGGPPVAAGEGGTWVEGHASQARLIAGAAEPDGSEMLAGVHIRLQRGWHTYWRTPGDSGLPPQLDWAGSRNLKTAHVLYPAPRRFRDPTGAYTGYAGEVVFPVVLTPQRVGEPIDLELTLHYAICKDLCVPAEAQLSLRVPQSADAARHDALVSRYLSRVPKSPQDGTGAPFVRGVTAELDAPSPYLLVEATFPGGAADADLFVEGADGMHFPAPVKAGDDDPETVRFEIDLSGKRNLERLRGATLTLTLVSALSRAEVAWTIE